MKISMFSSRNGQSPTSQQEKIGNSIHSDDSHSTDNSLDLKKHAIPQKGGMLVLLSLAFLLLVCLMVHLYFEGIFLPSRISWETRSLPLNLDSTPIQNNPLDRNNPLDQNDPLDRNNPLDQKSPLNKNYTLELSGKRARLLGKERETLWKSPREYRVQDILSMDIDRDGSDEILLLAWKIGKYGIAHPFFEKDNDLRWSQHIFIYDVISGSDDVISGSDDVISGSDDEKADMGSDGNSDDVRVKSIWGASELGQEVQKWVADDENCIYLTDTEGTTTRFSWAEWGLVPVDNSLSILAYGDNLIHDTCYQYGLENRFGNFDYLYEDLREDIRAADYSFLNLETILVDSPSAYGGFPRFGTPIEVGQAIARAGFTGVTCATNHCLDRGAYGLNTTMNFFREKNILCLGIGGKDYEIIQKGGIKVGLCNFSYGTNGMPIPEEMKAGENQTAVHPDETNEENETIKVEKQTAVNLLDSEEDVSNVIKRAAEECDAVVVFVHWGEEYEKEPSDEQKSWAKVMKDAGASAIIGTHPHVVQPLDDSLGIPVFYSLGNLVSSQQDPEKNEGAKAYLRFEKGPEGISLATYYMTEINPSNGISNNGY